MLAWYECRELLKVYIYWTEVVLFTVCNIWTYRDKRTESTILLTTSMSHICFLCGIWKGLSLKREGSRSLLLQHLTCQVSVSCQTSTFQCYLQNYTQLQPNSCCCFHDVLIFLAMELSTIKDFQLLTDNLPLTAPSTTVLKMVPVAPKLQQ